ncbi:MAG: glycosyltransferase family 4 protein [Deltaproteobacteria bacterium]|nr:glycosyltransferase family 4 protein [Deltaproteobacteria bacterium]
MNKKVVKFLSQSFLPIQGRYPRIWAEAITLKHAGFDVLVLGWDRIGNSPIVETRQGIRIERIRVRSREMRGPVQAFFILLFFIKAFFRLLREQVDIVHCHNLDVLPLGWLVSRIKRCRLIYDAHEPDYYALWPEKWRRLLGLINSIEAFFAKRADWVIVTNEYQVEKFKAMGVENVELIGNYPVDDFIIDNLLEERKEDVVFGRIGTLYPDVGIEEAGEAFKMVAEKHPQVKMLLAGRVVESYKETVTKVADALRGLLILIPAYNASEMPALYAKIDVSLMIYRRTDWFRNITPTKFYDSLANGVPVIMTDIGGIGEIIQRHNCGLVVDENDVEGIARAMERLIEEPGLRRTMAQNGLRLIKEEFNWRRMEERLRHVYSAL